MSLRQKYLKILSGLVPAGVAGVSLLLAATTPGSASQQPAAREPKAAQEGRVGERLAAIREAVSTVAGQEAAQGTDIDKLRLAWGNWWRNWGWGQPRGWGWPNWPNWHNWRNWPNWWRNW